MDKSVSKKHLRKSIEVEPVHKFDDATLEMFYERREKHLTGKSKSYTSKEVSDFIRGLKKK